MPFAKRFKRFLLFLLALLTAALPASPAFAAPPQPTHLFKVATLAPEGSTWAKRFAEFDAEVRKNTAGEVGFQIYCGGVMGDDRAMLRKMKIGQLQGAGVTMTGLAEVVPDFRVMSIPFLFQNLTETDAVRKKIQPRLAEALEKKDLTLLAISEVGFVYTMSTDPIAVPADLKKGKCWVPEGDPLSLRFLEEAGVSPVPLSIPDVLLSLQTGLLNTVFNSPYGAIVLQWFTKTRYISDIPFGYAYGGLVLDSKAFGRLNPAQRAAVQTAADRYLLELLQQDTRKSNEEAQKTLLAGGIQTTATSPETRKAYEGFRDQAVAREMGKSFSQEIHAEVLQSLAEVRQGKPDRP